MWIQVGEKKKKKRQRKLLIFKHEYDYEYPHLLICHKAHNAIIRLMIFLLNTKKFEETLKCYRSKSFLWYDIYIYIFCKSNAWISRILKLNLFCKTCIMLLKNLPKIKVVMMMMMMIMIIIILCGYLSVWIYINLISTKIQIWKQMPEKHLIYLLYFPIFLRFQKDSEDRWWNTAYLWVFHWSSCNVNLTSNLSWIYIMKASVCV